MIPSRSSPSSSSRLEHIIPFEVTRGPPPPSAPCRPGTVAPGKPSTRRQGQRGHWARHRPAAVRRRRHQRSAPATCRHRGGARRSARGQCRKSASRAAGSSIPSASSPMALSVAASARRSRQFRDRSFSQDSENFFPPPLRHTGARKVGVERGETIMLQRACRHRRRRANRSSRISAWPAGRRRPRRRSPATGRGHSCRRQHAPVDHPAAAQQLHPAVARDRRHCRSTRRPPVLASRHRPRPRVR